MTYAQNSAAFKAAMLPADILTRLRDHGLTDEDVGILLDIQAHQRGSGSPVLPILVLAGIEPLKRHADAKFSNTIEKLSATKPLKRRKCGGLHVTLMPVHADSVQTGSDAEQAFVTPFGLGQFKTAKRAIYQLFKMATSSRNRSKSGEPVNELDTRLRAFRHNSKDLALLLIDKIQYYKGWCTPSLESLAEALGLCVKTISTILRVLADLDIIQWVRRYDYTYTKDEGARSEQTSNLYRFKIPRWLQEAMNETAPPVPDDEAQRRQDALEANGEMLASASPADRRRFMPDRVDERAQLLSAAYHASERRLSESQRGGAEQSGRDGKKYNDPHTSFILSSEIRSCPSRATLKPWRAQDTETLKTNKASASAGLKDAGASPPQCSPEGASGLRSSPNDQLRSTKGRNP